MPGKIKVKVLAGRNLPVMDRAGDTTDAFVEIKFGGITHKTDVCRKSLNPQWNSTEWYRFEVDESELQDEPLQLRLMDHDTYSANDAIGKVVISLSPLLAREAHNVKGTAAPPGGAVMSGWIPVFDTMHGIRGELNVIVKVELFSDFNKYKTSSCGVQFFHCPMIPPGYRATSVHGFVEELVVNDDPEYQWIDKIRTPRASNEARQVAFIKLSNQVQRLVGLKAAELGANAVVGYQQDFDLEGEAGVVARAIGTAVSITPLPLPSQPSNIPPCTQQQLKKYLDILATDNDSVTDLNQYYQTHSEELQKLLIILNPKNPTLLDETDNAEDDDRSVLTRQSSIKSYAGSVSIYQDDYVSQKSLRHIADDQTDLNKLLNRVDESESLNPLKKIKKFKTNFFLKRLGNMRSKRSEKREQEDQISLKSNSSDTSKISLVDIKNEIKKLRRLQKPKFRKAFVNVDDQGIGMASILARSVIHAHTSLACIAETQDSEHSPNSTLRRTSESEPTINMSDEDKVVKIIVPNDDTTSYSGKKDIPEIHFTSMTNISSDNVELPIKKTLSESCPSTPLACRTDNLLKLPGEPGYFGSVSSVLSGESSEIYSSSDDDYESSDQKTDNEKVVETTSSVVQSVMIQMERKLSVLDNSPSSVPSDISTEENRAEQPLNANVVLATKVETDKKPITEENVQTNEKLQSSEEDSNTFVPTKSNAYHFKFHNPFSHKRTQSVSAPSSPVESRGFVYRSSKKIKQQFSKLSKSSMIKSLSHYSLIPKKKQVEIKSPMSQPASSSDMTSKAPSDTVLGSPFLSYADLLSLDKESLEQTKMNKNEDLNRSKVSMYIGSEPQSRASFSGTYFSDDMQFDHNHQRKESSALKSTGLVHTAMETILIDRVQSLLIPTSPNSTQPEKKFFRDVSQKLEQVEESRGSKPESTGLVHSAMETILMDKVQSLVPSTSPPYSPTKSSFETNFSEKSMESGESGTSKRNSKKKKDSDQESTGLVHTAMETILIDKVQSLFSGPVPIVVEENISKVGNEPTKEVPKHRESTGLINTAVQTILMDKAKALIGVSGVDNDFENIRNEETHSEEKDNISSKTSDIEEEPSLITKVQSFFSAKDKSPDDSIKSEKNESIGLVHSAVETMLVDKIQSLLPETECEDKEKNTHPKLEDKKSLSKDRKLVRQDSIHSVSETEESHKMSKQLEPSRKKALRAPVLQNFHPILSGAVLETIPSLPESSFDRTESIDERQAVCCKCVCSIDTNSASVCGNSHAVCDVCRCERDKDKGEKEKGSPRHARHESYGSREPVTPHAQNSSLTTASTPMGMHRRSSDSDLSVTPKGSSLNASAVNPSSGGGAILRPSMNSNNLEMLEYPFLTMTEYPPGFIVHIGGTVCARSVKLVDGGGESAVRAAWWAELRTELRAHARALRCNAVIAYTDTAAIYEDVCVLSASGTAAVINLDCDFNAEIDSAVSVANGNKSTIEEIELESCCVAHVPYSPGAGPYRAELSTCGGCRRARVPAVLLATCSKPNRLLSYPKAVTLTAVAARTRRAPPASEPGARDISDQLPFLEYELHKLLLAKLRMQGANALFSLQTQITIGERCVMALASGTAVRIAALPPPAPPRIKATENDKEALEIQKALWDSFTANKIANGFDTGGPEHSTNGVLPEIEGEDPPPLDLCADKDACVLELDEAEDVETARTLATRRLHTRLQVYTNALKPLKGAPPYAFTQVWRGKITSGGAGGVRGAGERQVAKALDALAYKLRRLQPAALLAASFRLDLPDSEARGKITSGGAGGVLNEVAKALDALAYKLRRLQPAALLAASFRLDLPDDEIQLVVTAAATRLQDPNKPEPSENGHSQSTSQTSQSSQSASQQGHINATGDADDEIFTLDEEQLIKSSHSEPVDDKTVVNGQVPTTVSLTSLCYVSGARIVRRVCALRLLFVRETTTVRELGGLSGFLHTFTSEVLAIVRAYTAALGGNALTSFLTQLMLYDNMLTNDTTHKTTDLLVLAIVRAYTAALGGNALTSFYLTQLMLQDNAHKNQGQCLLSVGGDVVHITY